MKRLTKLILNMLAYSNDLGFTDHTRNIKFTIEKGTIKQTMARPVSVSINFCMKFVERYVISLVCATLTFNLVFSF